MSIAERVKAEEARQYELRRDEARKKQRSNLYRELMLPVLIAFFAKLQDQLAPIAVVVKPGKDETWSHTYWAQIGDYNSFPSDSGGPSGTIAFGACYEPGTGKLTLHYGRSTDKSLQDAKSRFEMLLQWPNYSDAYWQALLEAAWQHVDAHYNDKQDFWRQGNHNDFWIGFEPPPAPTPEQQAGPEKPAKKAKAGTK